MSLRGIKHYLERLFLLFALGFVLIPLLAKAESVVIFPVCDLIYPVKAVSLLDKLEFSYIAQEKLRQDYNLMGSQFRSGVLSASEWRSYQLEFRSKNKWLAWSIAFIEESLGASDRVVASKDSLSGFVPIVKDYIVDKAVLKRSEVFDVDLGNLLK